MNNKNKTGDINFEGNELYGAYYADFHKEHYEDYYERRKNEMDDKSIKESFDEMSKEGYRQYMEDCSKRGCQFIGDKCCTSHFFGKYRFKLLLTFYDKEAFTSDRVHCVEFAYAFQEEVMKRAVQKLSSFLKLRTDERWYYGINLSKEGEDETSCHLAFTYTKDIQNEDMIAALEKTKKFLSEYGLDLAYLLESKKHGRIPIESLDGIADFFTSPFDDFQILSLYPSVTIFKSSNEWDNTPILEDDAGEDVQLEFAC